MNKLPIAFDVSNSNWNQIVPIRFIIYNKDKTEFCFIVMKYGKDEIGNSDFHLTRDLLSFVKEHKLKLIYE